ncbi:hypothetical protein N8D56_19050 [Devosia sp. A8/3-2]|nr:hypothetical protein N8D56_19050 [Devosia sp. A8/3-2]
MALSEHVTILQEEAEQGRQVIDLDIAAHIGGGKADRAALHRLGQDLEIVEPQHCMLARCGAADGSGAAIGKNDGNAAVAGCPIRATPMRSTSHDTK